jgi:hypothetical protein
MIERKRMVGFDMRPDFMLGENQGGFQVSTVSTTKWEEMKDSWKHQDEVDF